MSMTAMPKRLWPWVLTYEARILSMCARGRDGIPGLEKLTGDTVDITEWLDFTLWDQVWYEHSPETGFKAGRWLSGPPNRTHT